MLRIMYRVTAHRDRFDHRVAGGAERLEGLLEVEGEDRDECRRRARQRGLRVFRGCRNVRVYPRRVREVWS